MNGGTKESYQFDHDGNLTIKRETVLDDVFDACHDLRTLTPGFGKFGKTQAAGHHVASISADVAINELPKHGIDIFNMTPEMAKKLKWWLNFEAPKFKTIDAKL